MNDSRQATSQVAFALLLGTCLTLILRPAEMHAALNNLPIYEGFILATLLFGFPSLVQHLVWRNLRQQPAVICAIGVMVAIAMSHLSHAYLSGALFSTSDFSKTLLLFGLTVSLTTTIRRMKVLMAVLALGGTIAAGLSVLDFTEFHDFEFVTQLSDTGELSDTNEQLRTMRMRGIGIFSDPNDFSVLIVFCGMISLYFLNDDKHGSLRYVWLLPLVVLAAGLIYTKSRGGLMSVAVGLMVYVLCRYGKKGFLPAGVLGMCLLPVAILLRGGSGFGGSGTGHERVVLWREGLFAMRSPNLLFGTGMDSYQDIAGLVAHNSFVHAFVELGLFGGTLFLGCFFFPALGYYRLRSRLWNIAHPDVLRMYPYMAAMLAAWTMGLLSLSRAYTVSTYVMLGIQVAFANLAGRHLVEQRVLAMWDKPHLERLLGCSAVVFLGFNFFVEIFAR